MNIRHLFIPVMSVLIIFLTVSGTSIESKSVFEGKELIVLRNIGHELLLRSGDTSSRVLPVKQVAEGEYQITFGKPLSLLPDSIVNIISRNVINNSLPASYITNVLDCSTNEVVYGFAMSPQLNESIVPCLSRTLPKDCYKIDIKFDAGRGTGMRKPYYIAAIGIALLTVLPFIARRFYKPASKTKEEGKTPAVTVGKEIPLGNFNFYFEQQYLQLDDKRIELTGKESKLLYILASSPNLFVERKMLQKEVWENEGVIVTRSLDVFISKLRKKLEADPAVKLVNIHGKGYKLEVRSHEANS